MKCLITGGAGFIGSRLASKLYHLGAQVTVLDSLSEQVHGPKAEFSPYLSSIVSCVRADVRDRKEMSRQIAGQDVVVHLAAETGTGQSMYEVQRYEAVNISGTATILDVIVNDRPRSIKKLMVASSRAVYGEGGYSCNTCGVVYPKERSASRMSRGLFDPVCPHCNGTLSSLPTAEGAPFSPSSFYGLTKQVQEQMVLMFGRSVGIDAFALRYQNVFGPGQSLSNPYTGILAVFSNLLRLGKDLRIFEDGHQSRDFVYVDDVVDATAAFLDDAVKGVHAINIGSGCGITVLKVAESIRNYFQANSSIRVTGEFRTGDIRHSLSTTDALFEHTGFRPSWRFEEGLTEFLSWAETLDAADAGFDVSLSELSERGLLLSASSS